MHSSHVVLASARVTFSPLLFTLLLKDLEHFLGQHTPGITTDCIDDDISVLFKLFISLYADNMDMFVENPKGHQDETICFLLPLLAGLYHVGQVRAILQPNIPSSFRFLQRCLNRLLLKW